MKGMPIRFRVRDIMVVVAGFALLLTASIGASRLLPRSRRFEQLSRFHAIVQRSCSEDLAALVGMDRVVEAKLGRLRSDPGVSAARVIKLQTYEADLSSQADRARRRLAYHAGLAEVYARAAARPWLAVSPAPPEPR